MEWKSMVGLVSRTGRHMQRYNFHGHRQVVGCIPYRYKSGYETCMVHNEDEIEVLVITSHREGKGMLFPKRNYNPKSDPLCSELQASFFGSSCTRNYNPKSDPLCSELQASFFGSSCTFWTATRGGWEKDESIEAAALRETVEEAGVVGDVERKLGKWSFNSKNEETWYEGHLFPLFVKEQLEFWPEKNVRQRIWISVREARKVCHYWWMKEGLDLLVNRLTTSAS